MNTHVHIYIYIYRKRNLYAYMYIQTILGNRCANNKQATYSLPNRNNRNNRACVYICTCFPKILRGGE